MSTIHERIIGRILSNKSSRKEDLKILTKISEEGDALGHSKVTIANKLQALQRFNLAVKKPYEDVEKEDTIKYFSKISGNYKDGSLDTLRAIIKWFYSWLGKPEVVDWIKFTNGHKTKLPEELLTQQEIKTLVDTAASFRNKAIVMILYDGALRVGELVNLKIKNLIFDDYGGYVIVPKGKTGMRKVRLVDAIPYLKDYVNKEHPNKDTPDSYLFVGVSGKGSRNESLGKQVDTGGIRIMLRRLATRSKIKKRVYPHIFRHVKMTEMAKEFTEQEMKIFAGWTAGSNSPRVYIHLSGKDIDDKILEKRGLIKKDKIEKKNLLEPIRCIDPSCGYVNPVTNKFCEECHRPLDVKTILDIEAKNKIADVGYERALEKSGEFKVDKSVLKDVIKEMIKSGEIKL